MADEKVMGAETSQVSRHQVKMKNVRNKSGHRVELIVNNQVVVFLPGKITRVPEDTDIPNGLGLYVR